jgi:hypothetical protein
VLEALGSEHELRFAVLLFAADGLGVHQPLRFAGAARVLLLDTGEASDTEKAADLGACGIQLGSRLLSVSQRLPFACIVGDPPARGEQQRNSL